MNRTYLASLVMAVLAAAGHACAGEITVDPEPFVSVASRAEVREELRQFRQAGINPWADEYNPIAQFHGSMSRAEVRAAYIAEREATAALLGEDSGSSYLARAHAPASRRSTELAHAE